MKTLQQILIFLSITCMYGQEKEATKSLEGFYNLSGFESSKRLYLLDNNVFHYYAIFGSVDLEIFGKYTIENNNIYFYPEEEQMRPYILYGRNDSQMKDSIEFKYIKSFRNEELLFFKLDEKWVKNPKYARTRDEIQYKVKKDTVNKLILNLATETKKEIEKKIITLETLESFSAKIPKGFNDFLLTYNLYYKMQKNFAQFPMVLEGDAIVSEGEKSERRDLPENDKENITKYITNKNVHPSVEEAYGKYFQKVMLTKEEDKYIFELLINGVSREIKFATKPYLLRSLNKN